MLALLALLVGLASCWHNEPSYHGNPFGIVKFVTDHFTFTEKSKSVPKSPPIFCNVSSMGPLHPTIIVYTITDKQQQDQILDLIRQYKERDRLDALVIEFYREENWNCTTNAVGTIGCSRGPEELLRTEKFR
jgi:hypothetical protein